MMERNQVPRKKELVILRRSLVDANQFSLWKQIEPLFEGKVSLPRLKEPAKYLY